MAHRTPLMLVWLAASGCVGEVMDGAPADTADTPELGIDGTGGTPSAGKPRSVGPDMTGTNPSSAANQPLPTFAKDPQLQFKCSDPSLRAGVEKGLRKLTRQEVLNTLEDLFGPRFLALLVNQTQAI